MSKYCIYIYLRDNKTLKFDYNKQYERDQAYQLIQKQRANESFMYKGVNFTSDNILCMSKTKLIFEEDK